MERHVLIALGQHMCHKARRWHNSLLSSRRGAVLSHGARTVFAAPNQVQGGTRK